MNPIKFLHNTTFSVQLKYIARSLTLSDLPLIHEPRDRFALLHEFKKSLNLFTDILLLCTLTYTDEEMVTGKETEIGA